MTSTLPRFWMIGFVAVIGAACTSTVSKSGDYAPAPLPIPGCPTNKPPSSQRELEACLTTLRFDSVPLAGDEQPLAVIDKQGTACPGNKGSNCRYGPLAKIEPEEHAHSWDAAAMRQGRIIARLFLLPGESEKYPKFGLVPGGTTYWWVQHDGKSGRSVYITLTRAATVDTVGRPLEVYPYDLKTRISQALARWIWDPKDEKTAGSCGSASSCK